MRIKKENRLIPLKIRKGTVGTRFQKALWEIYRFIGPSARTLTLLPDPQAPQLLLAWSLLPPPQKTLMESLSPKALLKASASASLPQLKAQVVRFLMRLSLRAEHSVTKNLASILSLWTPFHRFISFDFFHLVARMDPLIPEGDFDYQPSFEPMAESYLRNDLVEFFDLLPPLSEEVSWQPLLWACNQCTPPECKSISPRDWSHFLSFCYRLKKESPLSRTAIPGNHSPSPLSSREAWSLLMRWLKERAEGTINQLAVEQQRHRTRLLLKKLLPNSNFSPQALPWPLQGSEGSLMSATEVLRLFVPAVYPLLTSLRRQIDDNSPRELSGEVRDLKQILSTLSHLAGELPKDKLPRSFSPEQKIHYRRLANSFYKCFSQTASLLGELGKNSPFSDSRMNRFLDQITQKISAIVSLLRLYAQRIGLPFQLCSYMPTAALSYGLCEGEKKNTQPAGLGRLALSTPKEGNIHCYLS